MTRLRNWLTAAAVAVVAAAGALTLPDALEQQAQLIVPEMTCDEWEEVIRTRDNRRKTFWVAVTHAQVQLGIPEVHVDRVIGTQSGKTMVITRSDCPGQEYTYKFDAVREGDVWIGKTEADPYIMRSWQLADALTGIVYLGTYAEAPQSCVDNAVELGLTPGPAGKCRDLLRAGNDCWVQDDGRLCRYGFYPAPDADGNPVACTVTAGSTWHPCVGWAGEDPATLASEATPDLSEE